MGPNAALPQCTTAARPPATRCTSPLTPSVPPEPSGAQPLRPPPAPPPRARPLLARSEPQGTPGAARAPHLNVTFSWEHASEGAAFLQQQAWRCFISKGRLPLRAEGPLRNRDGWGPDDSRKSGSPLILLRWPVHLCPATCSYLSTVPEEGNRRVPRAPGSLGTATTGLRASGDKRLSPPRPL